MRSHTRFLSFERSGMVPTSPGLNPVSSSFSLVSFSHPVGRVPASVLLRTLNACSSFICPTVAGSVPVNLLSWKYSPLTRIQLPKSGTCPRNLLPCMYSACRLVSIHIDSGTRPCNCFSPMLRTVTTWCSCENCAHVTPSHSQTSSSCQPSLMKSSGSFSMASLSSSITLSCEGNKGPCPLDSPRASLNKTATTTVRNPLKPAPCIAPVARLSRTKLDLPSALLPPAASW
mmetsp:Transcript_9825/g.18481  ORF Transcript_9825/g.18481 Transcript_9825/m.18481 type:complete len:230 (+) Transcript_9825:704-1393(+)